MRLKYFLIINLLLTTLFLPKINGQCTLPSGTYQWGLSNLSNFINNNCGASPIDLIIPTDATISIKNNDTWDLTSYGAMTITIEGDGSLEFNGTDDLTMATGSFIIIEEITNNDALSVSGSNVSINIGAITYLGNEFPDIIAAGIAPLFSLPVELTNFLSYSLEETNEVQLVWETASEINNRHFEIEHSLDGRDFKIIGNVEGNGSTSLNQKYSFIHNTPFQGNNYYRLKQVNYDLSYEYSDVIFQILENNKAVQIKVNSLNLLSLELNKPAHILVLDMAGKIAFENIIDKGGNDFYFENLSRGNYIVHVFNSTFSEQIMISR